MSLDTIRTPNDKKNLQQRSTGNDKGEMLNDMGRDVSVDSEFRSPFCHKCRCTFFGRQQRDFHYVRS
jgi:hypothetical protein